jgi:hypothetical protein
MRQGINVSAVGQQWKRNRDEHGRTRKDELRLGMRGFYTSENTHERTLPDCGSEGRGFEPRRSPS